MLRLIVILLLSLTTPAIAAAQQAPADRARVLSVLSYDCGTDSALDSFNRAMLAIGPSAQPLLLQVLQEGAPADIRTAEQRRLGERHAALQSALKDQGAHLLAASNGASLPSRDAFIADGLRRLDAKYRDNAVRGLGVVGGPDASDPLRRAAAANPDLAALVAAATAGIAARHRN
jgi:hypothetical protein